MNINGSHDVRHPAHYKKSGKKASERNTTPNFAPCGGTFDGNDANGEVGEGYQD